MKRQRQTGGHPGGPVGNQGGLVALPRSRRLSLATPRHREGAPCLWRAASSQFRPQAPTALLTAVSACPFFSDTRQADRGRPPWISNGAHARRSSKRGGRPIWPQRRPHTPHSGDGIGARTNHKLVVRGPPRPAVPLNPILAGQACSVHDDTHHAGNCSPLYVALSHQGGLSERVRAPCGVPMHTRKLFRRSTVRRLSSALGTSCDMGERCRQDRPPAVRTARHHRDPRQWMGTLIGDSGWFNKWPRSGACGTTARCAHDSCRSQRTSTASTKSRAMREGTAAPHVKLETTASWSLWAQNDKAITSHKSGVPQPQRRRLGCATHAQSGCAVHDSSSPGKYPSHGAAPGASLALLRLLALFLTSRRILLSQHADCMRCRTCTPKGPLGCPARRHPA